jgi:hypothetical protein
MEKKNWIGILIAAAMLGVTVWAFYYRPAHLIGRATSPAGPLITFTPAGRYTYGPDTLFAVCTSRGDLLYLAEGKLATSPSLAVALGGCSSRGVQRPALPSPR